MSASNIEFGENIDFSIKKRFGIIKLNRPEKANALTPEMVKNLRNAIVFCQENEKIYGILLTGEGKSFTTGMDMNSIDPGDNRAARVYEKIAAEIAELLYNGKPTVCAINGKAMGDGVAYSLCSDYRIAMKESYFMMPEVNIGIFPGGGTVVLMTRVLGIPWTKRILMFAEKINAEQAVKIGLIDQIVDSKDDLITEAMKKVKFLSMKNRFVLNGIKLCSNHLMDKPYSEAYQIEKSFIEGWMDVSNREKFLEEFKRKLI